MSDESTTSDEEELAAAFRMGFPDGTDWAHVVRDDAAWAAFSVDEAPPGERLDVADFHASLGELLAAGLGVVNDHL